MKKIPDGNFIYSLVSKLAPNLEDVAAWIDELRRENPDLSNDELADFVGDNIVWAYTSQGAALALPGAIPGLGTIVQVSTEIGFATADIALMVRNQSYLVFALGCIYGYKNRATLIQDTIISIGLWSKSVSLTRTGAIRLGTKIANANFKKRFPAKIFEAINRKVGTTVLTKYGTKRGGVAVGTLIPFGVGVLIGGGFNYITMKKFKHSTTNLFSFKIKRRKKQ